MPVVHGMARLVAQGRTGNGPRHRAHKAAGERADGGTEHGHHGAYGRTRSRSHAYVEKTGGRARVYCVEVSEDKKNSALFCEDSDTRMLS